MGEYMSRITHIPKKVEALTASQFLSQIKSDRSNIESVKYVAPKIGDGTFGEFVVTYKFAKLTPAHG